MNSRSGTGEKRRAGIIKSTARESYSSGNEWVCRLILKKDLIMKIEVEWKKLKIKENK